MPASESVGPGSIPGRATDLTILGVCWIARDPATVEDQVRFLARILERFVVRRLGREPIAYASVHTNTSTGTIASIQQLVTRAPV